MKKLIIIAMIFIANLANAQVYLLKSPTESSDYNYYGIQYDYSTDAITRIGTTQGVAIGTKPDESLLPIQSKMRRCVIDDAGVVQYYLDRNNSLLKEAGDSAKLDGTDGQVMVEIPKFYYRYTVLPNGYEWAISESAISGFSVVPAFVDSSGAEKDYIYIGAYPGVLYDASATAYIDGDGSGAQYAAGDILSSVSGFKPITGETRATFRTAAEARGTGWHLLDGEILFAVQLLYITEYADFDAQTMLGEGNTKFAAWDFATTIAATGKSNLLGNASGGQATVGGNSADYVSYRGIEDFYGNVWQFVDGVNINNDGVSSKLYLAEDYRVYADDTATDYSYVGNLAESDGYIKYLLRSDKTIMPLTVGGSSSTYFSDYYWTYYNDNSSVGWRVLLFGGKSQNGVKAGAFYVYSADGSSTAGSTIGARLCFAGN